MKSNTIVLIADPKVLSIPIHENREPLIDIRDEGALAFGPSPEIPNNTNYTKMRKTVYEKLLYAQDCLPPRMRLCLYEAYRSLSLQKKLFDERFLKNKNIHPHWTHEAIFEETTKLVSPVINLDGSTNIPPHATGGAIDVYLIDETGAPLDMGMHPKDWVDDGDGELSKTISLCISKVAQCHRDIMSAALKQAGFENYPTEYWHWSYGDRYWAYQTGANAALYGCLDQACE